MEGKDWVELLKFPLTILTAIIAIIVFSLVLNIKPTNVEIGEIKIELETELRKELTNANIDFEKIIRDQVSNQLLRFNADSLLSPTQDSTLQNEDVVSDNIAKIATIQTDAGIQNVFKSTIGYIWIGNYNPITHTSFKIKINSDDLNKVETGQEYFVNGNMVIRETSPVNSINYFRDVNKIGLATKGSKIKILESPQVKTINENYQQFWVKIIVLE